MTRVLLMPILEYDVATGSALNADADPDSPGRIAPPVASRSELTRTARNRMPAHPQLYQHNPTGPGARAGAAVGSTG